MLSIVEVKCPHCGVRGQIMLPPLGAIIVGPCPNCDELVVVFCGRVLALNKEVMVNGSNEEKHEHMKEVLVEFIDDRIGKIVEQLTPEIVEGLRDYTPENDGHEPTLEEKTPDLDLVEPLQISVEEVRHFVNEDLPWIDNRFYFHAIFR